jgi:hypothetical protein
VPRILKWRTNLATLNPFLRKLFWVYGCFIVMVIIGFAALTFRHADAMAAGEPVARSLCAFIAIFWAARLVVQLSIFDPWPFLTNWFYRLAYHTLTFIFAILVLIYGWAAIFPHTQRNVGVLPVRPAGTLFAASATERSKTPLTAQTSSLCSTPMRDHLRTE